MFKHLYHIPYEIDIRHPWFFAGVAPLRYGHWKVPLFVFTVISLGVGTQRPPLFFFSTKKHCRSKKRTAHIKKSEVTVTVKVLQHIYNIYHIQCHPLKPAFLHFHSHPCNLAAPFQPRSLLYNVNNLKKHRKTSKNQRKDIPLDNLKCKRHRKTKK